MRTFWKSAGLSLALALSVGASAAVARDKKMKPSAEHIAAIKKCNDDYTAAVKDAKGKKGKDRKDAMTGAKTARKQCVATAPK